MTESFTRKKAEEILTQFETTAKQILEQTKVPYDIEPKLDEMQARLDIVAKRIILQQKEIEYNAARRDLQDAIERASHLPGCDEFALECSGSRDVQTEVGQS